MAKLSKWYLKPTDFTPSGSLFEGLIWHLPNSKGTDTYAVECTDRGFTCECPGFSFRGRCKHSQSVSDQVSAALRDEHPVYTV